MAELAHDYRARKLRFVFRWERILAGETTMVDLNLTARNLEISSRPNNICDEKQ